MAITNTNVATRVDDDNPINSSFVRIIKIDITDVNEVKSDVLIQFAFYKSKNKWEADFRKNRIDIEGLPTNSITVVYNRANHGVDLQLHLYNKLKDYLIATFPTWTRPKLVIELPTPV